MKTKYRIVKKEYHDFVRYKIERWVVCVWVEEDVHGLETLEAAREYIFRYCTPPKVTVVETIEV